MSGPSSSHDSSSPRPSAAWLFLLGVVLALFGVHAGHYWNFTVDDAGISFAYARHLADGHGLVLTPGAERVEAATNLLWCLALVPAKWLGFEHELFAKLLGLAGTSAALACVAFFPAVAYKRRPAYYDLVAPVVAACMPHLALWTVSGLETGLFTGLLAGALLALAREENDPRRFPWSAALLAALFATRPDGVLYIGVVGAAKLLRQITPRPPRQDLIWGFVLLLGVGALELFRLSYFAWPWPNSFYTKKRTFEFGKDVFDTRSAGWQYMLRWLDEYKLRKAVYATPLLLLGLRAPAARLAVLGAVGAALFFPVYSHGDWMEEYRFMAFGAPVIALAIAEAARAVARLPIALFPRSARPWVALAITPLLAYFVVKNTTQYYPERLRATQTHSTLEFWYVRQRARYFVNAGRRLAIDRRPSLLDPDVGGSSYDGRLTIVDLFGLGDIPIAQTHPVNPPGSREAIFWERRPTFVHLHGAWFGAMELHRLEELEQLYTRLPGRLPEGDTESDTNYVRRDAIAAPWYVPADLAPPEGVAANAGAAHPDAYTVSHHALEPGRRMMVELTYAGLGAGASNGAGVLSLVPDPGQGPRVRQLDVTLEPAGGLIEPSVWLRGERPRARAWFVATAGRYQLVWRNTVDGRSGRLGAVVVAPGAGERESSELARRMDEHLARDRYGEALRVARVLGLRVTADARDRTALAAIARYGQALGDRARRIANDGGAPRTAALLARAARAWAADDPQTIARAEAVAERLADDARDAQRAGERARAFVLAREAVLTDPQRAWSRRRAEELRPYHAAVYDGARDAAAYRMAADALAGAGDLERALVFLGSVERWTEAAALYERAQPQRPAGAQLTDPRARVVVARGLVARGQVTEALALVSGQPCAGAHDPELTAALRAVLGRPYRPGDSACAAPLAPPPAPFERGEGGFERGNYAGWTATGNAFGRAPAHTQPEHQTFVNGWNGWYYVNTFANGGDARTGTLRSRTFTVASEGISFLIGGGNDEAHLGVRLLVDGRPVLTATGRNDEALRRVFWDVRPYTGRAAQVEIYDESQTGWGHILADDFRAEPVLPPGVTAAPSEPAGETEPLPDPETLPLSPIVR